MNKVTLSGNGFLVVLFVGVLLSAPAWAGDHGKKYEKQHEKYEQKYERHEEVSNDTSLNMNVHFGDHERVVIHDYYEESEGKGHCPPGLRKKHNGCMPPGQAKKWKKGYPLPREVVYYDLPPRIIVEIGAPPAGHKYVRVASDILLIAVGTGIVVDAIEDLGKI